ncbi:MAG TPA: ATP-dependent Clp protease adaptor ClpS [Bacteroidales bacterium]|nr:ATP-dependent Clp protease adaptor ClpS [Bacteroidales bacterium]
MVKQKTYPKSKNEDSLTSSKELILHNDDFNTFDHVIESLVEICKHDTVQAEQCALIVHYKGKCMIKTGSLDSLEPLHNKLNNRNLTTSIE